MAKIGSAEAVYSSAPSKKEIKRKEAEEVVYTPLSKEEVGNQIQQDIAGKINYRFTPDFSRDNMPKIKSDIARAKASDEVANNITRQVAETVPIFQKEAFTPGGLKSAVVKDIKNNQENRFKRTLIPSVNYDSDEAELEAIRQKRTNAFVQKEKAQKNWNDWRNSEGTALQKGLDYIGGAEVNNLRQDLSNKENEYNLIDEEYTLKKQEIAEKRIQQKYGVNGNEYIALLEQKKDNAQSDSEKNHYENEIKRTRNELYGKTNVFEHIGNIAKEGLLQYNKGVAATVDFLLGTPAKWLGFENNIFTQANKDSTRWLEEASAETYKGSQSFGDTQNLTGQFGTALIAAAPDLLLTILSGGASKAPELGNAAIAAANPTFLNTLKNEIIQTVKSPIFYTSFVRELGTNYEENLESGANEAQATLAAFFASAVTAKMEIGGFQSLGDEIAETKGFWKKAYQYALSSMEEGLEEPAQTSATNLINKIVYDHDKKIISTTDEDSVFNLKRAAKEFAIGTFVGAALGGGQLTFSGIVNAKSDSQYKQIGKAAIKNTNIQEIIDYAKSSPNDVVRSIARQVEANTISDADAGRVYQYAVTSVNEQFDQVESVDDLNKVISEYFMTSTVPKAVRNIASAKFAEKLVEMNIDPETYEGLTPEKAMQTATAVESDDVDAVTPVEQSGEVSETPVESQQERETVFTEPTNQEIYRDPTDEENAEAIFGKRKSAKQRHIIDVAKKLDSNMKVVFVDKNSKSLNGKNGKYNRDTNTMYIAKDLETNDIKLVEAYVEVFKHEFVHRLELRKAYKSFKDYLFNKSVAFEKYAKARLYYIDRVDADLTREDAINALVDMYVENSKGDLNLTREQAEREAVADFVARTLFKEKSADFLMAVEDKNIYDKENGTGFAQMETDLEFFEEMANTDRTLLQKIIDAIRDLINSIKGMTNLEKDLQYIEERLVRVYESADNTKNRSNLNNEVFDIAVLENGNTYVKASRKVITGTTLKEQRAQITDFFKKLLKNKPSIDIPTIEGDILTITMENTEDKARDNYKLVDRKPVKMSNEEFAVKLRVESHIDEIAETAIKENKPLTPDEKNHEFAKDGFEYRTAYFEDFDGSYYKIRFSVGHNGTIATVYNVGKIKEDVPSSAKLIAVVGSQALDGPSSTDIIRNENDFVNNNSSEDSFSSDNLNTDYLKAVENGDVETAQRMVDEEAKSKGYDSPHLYHGTRSFGFTQFDLEKMDDKRSIFLTNNKKIASTYSGVTGTRNVSGSKEISNLSAQDIVDEFNAYEEQFSNDTTEGKGEYQLYDFEKFNKLLNDVNSGIEELAKTVDEQIKIYANKMATDFEEKDSKIHKQLVNLSESLKKYDYDNLSTPIYMLLHYSEVFDRSPEIAKLESNIRLMNKLRNMNLSEGVIASNHLGGYDIEVMSIDTARMELENKYKQGNMSLVAKLGKSLVIDGKNQNWNDIRNWQESAYRKRDEVEIKKINDEFKLYDKKTNTEIPNGVMAVNSFTEKLDKSNLLTMLLDNANYSLRILTENLFNTREIASWAKSNGYDSVTIKNIRDNGGWNAEVGYDETADIYIIFNPSNVKSADPVTYDDNGNVIPLSERFNDENVDIRYSSDDLSALQRNLYDRHKNGELTNEEYIEETDRLWENAKEEYGTLPQGEKAKVAANVPAAVSEDKPTERFIRTIIETDTLNGDMLKGMQESTLLGDFSYKVISDESAIKKADKAMENGTANDVWEETINSPRITKNEIAIGEQLLKKAIEKGDTVKVLKLSAELADVFTRAGQTVQAAQLFKKMTGPGRLVSLQRTVKTLNKDLRAKYGVEYPPIKIREETAKRLVEAETLNGIEYAYQEALQEVANQMPSTFLDKWNAWRYFAMLSNPKTHIRNVVGNAIFVPVVRIKDYIGSITESGLEQGKKTKSILVKKEYRDFAKKDAKLDSVKNLLKGNKYNDKSAIREKQKVFKSEALNFLTEFNSNALEAEDMLFKNIHYIHALAGFLQVRNVNLKNVSQEVLEEARIYAVKEAKKATFNDESALANAIQRFGNKNLGTSILVEGVLPFKRTPINIVKRGIEYSPIGLAKTLTKGLYDVKKGKITVSEYIDGLASSLTGTGIMLVGMFLASIGCITGGEDDDKESEFEKWLGKQEYAVEVFGKSYTVDWAAPSNIPFFIGVEIVNTAKEGEDFSLSQLGNAVWNSLEPITNLSMLSGMQSVIESARYADSAQTLSAIAVDAITSYGMQAVPSLSGALARTIDPTQRSWYIDKNDKVLDSTAQTIKNNIQSKVPGLSYTQIPKIDIWGREVSRGGTAERILENFVSPGYYSEIEVTETSEELKRIFNETDQDVFPNIAAKSFKVDGETKHLTAREYVIYAKTKGSYSYDYIKEFMESTAYKKLTDKEKADVITKLYEYANAKAKATVSNYDLMKQFKTVTNWERNGSSAVDYYIYRAISK